MKKTILGASAGILALMAALVPAEAGSRHHGFYKFHGHKFHGHRSHHGWHRRHFGVYHSYHGSGCDSYYWKWKHTGSYYWKQKYYSCKG
ncbi:MAG: hypothetical protein ACREC6_01495 [Hyphomicrobiaceae bacterium]